ncbi:MAG: hypothetical protein ACRDKT_18225 [Actinomycetota bacterium]
MNGDPRVDQDRMIVRQLIRPMVNIYEVTIAGPDGKTPGPMIAYAKQKRMRLKEEIRFFTDQSQAHPLFTLKARRVIEFGGHYDVIAPDGAVVGTVRKMAKKSLLRSTYELLGPDGQVSAWVQEESQGIAIFRRLKDLIPYGEYIPIPYHFTFHIGETVVGRYSRIIGLRDKYLLDLTPDAEKKVDRRVAIALAIALDALQAR